MTHFLCQGNRFRVAPNDAIDLRHCLPTATYAVKQDLQGLYLDKIDNFTLPAKLYGDTLKQTKRILSTFDDRPATTGVMLVGEKGSGKSLLAKNLCIEASRNEIPTIVVNSPYTGEEFNQLIQLIEQPCIMFFDEFEKVYDDHQDQERILTLLDGVYASKKLFIFTSNDKFRIVDHMQNRPGRIFYMLEYEGLSKDFIIEYCNDVLKNKTYTDRIIQVATVFAQFNFDMLKALVEEVNRYDEDPLDSVRWLNIKPEYAPPEQYEVTYEVDSVVQEHHIPSEQTVECRPLIRNFNVSCKQTVDKEIDEDGWVWQYYDLDPSMITHVDTVVGSFVYDFKNVRITLCRKQRQRTDYWKAF